MLSSTEGSGGISATAPLYSYSDKFNEYFPYYLSIGMTEEQYWDRDSTLVVPYRKAELIRNDRKNQEMWLQGMYIYEAVCRVSPILHAFAKKGAKPLPYIEEPFAITKKQVENQKEERQKRVYNKSKSMMESYMAAFNKKFEGK